MLNGILIDMDVDLLVIDRKVYTLTEWAGEVGGFSKTIGVIIAFLFPLISMSSVESFLILHLFKQSPKMRINSPNLIKNPVKKLLNMSETSLGYRKRF